MTELDLRLAAKHAQVVMDAQVEQAAVLDGHRRVQLSGKAQRLDELVLLECPPSTEETT